MALPGIQFNKVPTEKEGDHDFMSSVGLVATNNNTGCMFLRIDGYVDQWRDEWQPGGKPLLDLGCAFGIHTLHALKSGCDVISVDMDRVHIAELRSKAAKVKYSGKLISSHVARLPIDNPASLLPENSVSAVLLSEVLHFLQVGEPVRLFKQILYWLQPGGRVFVSTASPKGFANIMKLGATINGGKTEEEVMRVVEGATDEEIVEIAPSFTKFAESSALPHLYYLTTKELSAFARLAGFVIERLGYYSPRKYQVLYADREECVMMIARKPTAGSRDE